MVNTFTVGAVDKTGERLNAAYFGGSTLVLAQLLNKLKGFLVDDMPVHALKNLVLFDRQALDRFALVGRLDRSSYDGMAEIGAVGLPMTWAVP